MINQQLLVVCGPTASGKTAFFEKMAMGKPELRFECINADTGQMYKELRIGTAKPDLSSHPYPERYHLFDRLSYTEQFNVMRFRTEVERLCQEIWQRQGTPVVVGGSMFYINSLFFPPQQNLSQDPIKPFFEKVPTQELYQKLAAIDPIRARQILPQDRYRLERALTIWLEAGTKPSNLRPIFAPIAKTKLIFIDPGLEQLTVRIKDRAQIMLQEGWIEEVAGLMPCNGFIEFVNASHLIGYKEIVHWLKTGEGSKAQLLVRLSILTRDYAKKQCKFWRNLKKRLFAQDLAAVVSIEEVAE